ncbi:hypothetical protein K488DRAFT_91060 [Vararia minispora EC-137]|uniref:Uncharacterized protein n=1 Tax=Vararia minispora EC-137 TaxID=1314806 RepID=A0ACB8Q6P5_9AGAM|nr:hypothetical protein K488DRAFT_91060 [Vararia minispora EC-137]
MTNIHNLVNDILCQIFLIAQEDWPITSLAPLGWVSLSHVCSRWRTCLLNNHGFWARLIPIPNAWETLLTRAGSTVLYTLDLRPTRLLVPPHPPPPSGDVSDCCAFYAAKKCIPRVKVLACNDSHDWMDVLHNLHLPELRDLDVTGLPMNSGRIVSLNAPNLEFLHLRSISIAFDHPLLSLRALSLDGYGIPLPPTLFFGVLARVPRLEDLDMSLSRVPITNDQNLTPESKWDWESYTGKLVDLLHLRRVSICLIENSNVPGFLHRLRVPECTSFSFHCDSTPPPDPETLGQILDEIQPNCHLNEPDVLYINQSASFLELVLSRSTNKDVRMPRATGGALDPTLPVEGISFLLDSPRMPLAEVSASIERFIASACIEHVTHIDIDARKSPHEEIRAMLDGVMRSVHAKDFVVSGNLRHLLVVGEHERVGNKLECIPFPALLEVRMVMDASFWDGGADALEDWWGEINEVLAWRRQRSTGLERLTILGTLPGERKVEHASADRWGLRMVRNLVRELKDMRSEA